jgi:hypothetical protein
MREMSEKGRRKRNERLWDNKDNKNQTIKVRLMCLSKSGRKTKIVGYLHNSYITRF